MSTGLVRSDDVDRPLVVVVMNSLHAGGSQTYALELIARLHEQRYRTAVIAKHGSLASLFERAGSRVVPVSWREGDAVALSRAGVRVAGATALSLLGVRRLRRFLRVERPIALIASQPWPQYYAAIAARDLPVRLFSLFHGFTPVEMPPAGGSRTLAAYSGHFTSTVEAAAQLRRLCQTDAMVLGNLYSSKRYWGHERPWRRPRAAPQGHLVSLSTLSPGKTPAIEVAFRWLRANHDWTMTVVGGGPELPRLTSLSAGLGIEGRVVFTGAQSDPRPHLEGATVVLAVGRAALEAASRGIPVVVGAAAGIAGPIRLDSLHDLAAVNYTDRAVNRQPLTEMSFAHAMRQATQLPSEEVRAIGQALSEIGSVSGLLHAVGAT